MNLISEGILDDLARLPGDEVAAARAFSRTLNRLFKEGTVGSVRRKASIGGPRVRPTETLDKFFTGGEPGRLNFAQMREAVLKNPEEMADAQSMFVSALARDTVEIDGRVNPTKLDAFLKRNAGAIEDLGLGPVLREAGGKERLARKVEEITKNASAFFKDKTAIGKALKKEDVAVAVEDALFKSEEPVKALRDFAVAARKSKNPKAALGGLRHTVIESLLRRAEVRTGEGQSMISGRQLEALLSERRAGTTLKEQLQKTGLFSADDTKSFNSLIQETKKLEAAAKEVRSTDELFGKGSALFDLILRISGANIGGASAVGQAAGAPLIAAEAGSRTMRQIFAEMPKLRARNVLMEATRNPKLMADLLERETSVSRNVAREARIRVALINAGILDPLRDD